MKVRVKRSIDDWEEDIVDVNAINNVKWDYVSGGCYVPEAHYSLYGYIDYSVAKELNIACSGMHSFGYNSAKVRVSKPKNKSDECYEGYEYLKKLAGPKPDSSFIRTYCGRAIVDVLGDTIMSRKELMEILLSKGYERKEVSKVLRGLKEHGYVLDVLLENGKKGLKNYKEEQMSREELIDLLKRFM